MNKKFMSIHFVMMLVVSVFAIGYILGGEVKMVTGLTSLEPAISLQYQLQQGEITWGSLSPGQKALLSTELNIQDSVDVNLIEARDSAGKANYIEGQLMTGEKQWSDLDSSEILLLKNEYGVTSFEELQAQNNPAVEQVAASGAGPVGVVLPKSAITNTNYNNLYTYSAKSNGEVITLPDGTKIANNQNFKLTSTTTKVDGTDVTTYYYQEADSNGNLLGTQRPLGSGTEGENAFNTLKNNNVVSPVKDPNSEIGSVFGEKIYPWSGAGYLLQGVMWATAAAGVAAVIGGLLFSDPAEQKAFTAAIAAGVFVGRGVVGGLFGRGGFVDSNFGTSKVGSALGSVYGQVAIGAAAAWLTYNAMYSKEKTTYQTVNFQCMQWQAPRGGEDCDLCNDEKYPCSEYRCKSLGQTCSIINKGTAEERCVALNPRETNPPVMEPLQSVLTNGLTYTDVKKSPPGYGFSIKSDSTNGCVKPYQAIAFGIKTDKPSQCKLSLNQNQTYAQMEAYMGGDNLYKFNHSEYLTLPSAKDLQNSSLTLQNGKVMSLFIECQDALGNVNEAPYEVRICVDPTPDTTPPVIKATSIDSGSCVASNKDNATVQFYTDEPAECKWSFTDKSYDLMDYNMSCSSAVYEINALQLYTCNALLTAVSKVGTNYFVRCKDQPNAPANERNSNAESLQFSLRGSNPLKLSKLSPNETIYGAVRPMAVNVQADTLFGCNDNKAACYYSLTGVEGSFIKFFETDTIDGISTQRLDLNDGNYNIYVRCVDEGGNVAEGVTNVSVEIDTDAPIVARAYKEENLLKIITQRSSECVYSTQSCDYLFAEGTQMPYANSTVHTLTWLADKSFYIKCRDEFRTETGDCSIVINPTDNYANGAN